jgi:acyl-ACP thioesterase
MLLQHQLIWVLTRLEVRMDRYPAGGETITVETYPMPNRRWFCPRSFIFRDADGRQIGCAGSLWVLIDVHTRRMSRPDVIAGLMPDNHDLTAPIGLPATVEEVSADADCAFRAPVYTDLDVNGHVNNTRYLDWCCNALGIETMHNNELAAFAINFNQELLPGQQARTELRRNDRHFSFCGFMDQTRCFDVGGTLRPRA